MAVGGYSVSVEISGFENGVTGCHSGRSRAEPRREVNFTPENFAACSRQWEASDVAPTINTTTGTLGGLVTGQQVVTLPLNEAAM